MKHYANDASGCRLVGFLAWAAVLALVAAGCDKPAEVPPAGEIALAGATRDIVFGLGASDAADPLQAGKAAAQAARSRLGSSPVKAVLVSESYEDQPRKAKMLAGVFSVFDRSIVCGGSTYGSFTQSGVLTGESVAVLAVAGKDIAVSAACRTDMGTAGLTLEKNKVQIETALRAAGADLARKLPRTGKPSLLVVVADAHSPKNGALVAGIQDVLGKDFPITGGSVNKNAGQTVVYFGGRMLQGSAIALLLSGDFKLGMSGRKAKENDKVIATARTGAGEALARLAKSGGARPAIVLAFNCAGRKGKLKNPADELAAMQKALGRRVPLFGTYNAGEIGPADLAEKKPGVLSSGVGWHVMFTALGW